MSEREVILFHYRGSPYAKRMTWYLALRGIPYSQCMQPPVMPRPDLKHLGISYRRIPVLSIGKDVYLDTRLQLTKLESMFPSLPKLSASEIPGGEAIQRLLSTLMNDGGVFPRAAQLVPADAPLLNDPSFVKDRADFSGGALAKDRILKLRPEALTSMEQTFQFLENILLQDGREWVFDTKNPTVADIEALWAIHWVMRMPGSLPKDRFSDKIFPKVYGWEARFLAKVKEAEKSLGKIKTVKGEDAAKIIHGSDWAEQDISVDGKDAVVQGLGLSRGDQLMVWPTDTGSLHKDVGSLVGINTDEVVIRVGNGKEEVRVHAPRHGFRVKKVDAKGEPAKL